MRRIVGEGEGGEEVRGGGRVSGDEVRGLEGVVGGMGWGSGG